MGVFTKLETVITDKLHNILATYLAMFASKVVLLFQLGTPLLVLYYGYSIMTPRGSNAPAAEMLFNLARIGIVFAFVQNSSGLLDLSIGFIHELKTGFIEAKSLFSLLDEQFMTTQQLSEDIFDLDTSILKWQGKVASWMIWLGAILVLASSAIVFISAEVSLALLSVTSPIFIGCLTYSFTRELFNGWLRSIFSCIITLIFATLIVRIGIDFNNDVMNQLSSNPEEKNMVTIGATALLIGIVVSSLVLISTKLAGNIAGVAATSALQGAMTSVLKSGSNVLAANTALELQRIGSNRDSKSNKDKQQPEKQQDSTLNIESQKASLKQTRQTNSGG